MPGWAKGTLVLLVTLSAGVVLGVGLERRRADSHEAMMPRAHHLVELLQASLDLDAAQHDTIAAILARHQLAVDSTWHVMRPHVRATLDSSLREIAGVLRPDQLEKYRSMISVRHPGVLP